jgi:hypothetical protein
MFFFRAKLLAATDVTQAPGDLLITKRTNNFRAVARGSIDSG